MIQGSSARQCKHACITVRFVPTHSSRFRPVLFYKLPKVDLSQIEAHVCYNAVHLNTVPKELYTCSVTSTRPQALIKGLCANISGRAY